MGESDKRPGLQKNYRRIIIIKDNYKYDTF